MGHQGSVSWVEELGQGAGKGTWLRLELRSRSGTQQGHAETSQRAPGSETGNLEVIQAQNRALKMKWGHDTGDLEYCQDHGSDNVCHLELGRTFKPFLVFLEGEDTVPKEP